MVSISNVAREKIKTETLTVSPVIPRMPLGMRSTSTVHYCVPVTDVQPQWSTVQTIRVLPP
jgi:hypothetical protein